MLPKQLRLHLRTRADLFQIGERFREKHLVVIYHRAVDINSISQGAIIAPKTIFSQAVDRNLVKRRLSALLGKYLLQNSGLEMVILARPGAQKTASAILDQELSHFFNYLKHD